MADVYYPSFDCVLIDVNGVRTFAESKDIDVYNVTAASSLGSVNSGVNGVVAAGSFSATIGDIVEFSHATFPLTFRVKLSETLALAFTENNILAYVMENLGTLNPSDTALLFAADIDNPDVEPVLIGSGRSGTTAEIAYTSNVAKNLRIYARSQNDKEIAKTHFDTQSYDDIAIPALAVVTSVGLSVPSFLSVSGSPVTGSGTLAVSLASQSQNLVFASPNGSSGLPSFRALVAPDIPNLDAAKITTGTIGTARLGSGSASSANFLRGDSAWQNYLGANAHLSNSLFGVVAPGNGLEFGHSTAGYRGTLGAEAGTGKPFIAFHAEAGTNNDTYRTRNVKGSVLQSDLAGGFQFKTVANTSADNQTATLILALRNDGQVILGTQVSNARFVANSLAQSDSMTLGTSPGGGGFASTDGNYGTYFGISGSGFGWLQQGRTDGSATAYDFYMQEAGGNVGIGHHAASAKFHVISTTEQIRSGYSTSQYWKAMTDSAGKTTFTAVGTTPRFIFTNKIETESEIEFTDDGVGIILLDRTLATRHRIYLDNGVLLIEAA